MKRTMIAAVDRQHRRSYSDGGDQRDDRLASAMSAQRMAKLNAKTPQLMVTR